MCLYHGWSTSVVKWVFMLGTSDGKTERKEQAMEKDQNKKVVRIDMFNWGPCVITT